MVHTSSVFDDDAADTYLAALKAATGDVAAARARMMVDGFIRLDVPDHSRIAPSDALLSACNLRTSKMEGVAVEGGRWASEQVCGDQRGGWLTLSPRRNR